MGPGRDQEGTGLAHPFEASSTGGPADGEEFGKEFRFPDQSEETMKAPERPPERVVCSEMLLSPTLSRS